jgi:hypothetical protein
MLGGRTVRQALVRFRGMLKKTKKKKKKEKQKRLRK